MTTDNLEPLTDFHHGLPDVVDVRLVQLEHQRLKLVSDYEKILFDVSEGDDTGYALVRINAQLKKVTDEMQRLRSGE